MLKGFRDFVMRGSVVDLAVAVVIGAAFGAVVTEFVKDMLTPLIGIPGSVNFKDQTFSIRGSVFQYGAFVNAVITFVLIATAVYFAVIVPINALAKRRARKQAATTRPCPQCLTEIPLKATRCSACTTEVPAAA